MTQRYFLKQMLGPAQDNAIDYDQRHINTQRPIQSRAYPFNHHLNDADKCGDDNDITGDPDLIRMKFRIMAINALEQTNTKVAASPCLWRYSTMSKQPASDKA